MKRCSLFEMRLNTTFALTFKLHRLNSGLYEFCVQSRDNQYKAIEDRFDKRPNTVSYVFRRYYTRHHHQQRRLVYLQFGSIVLKAIYSLFHHQNGCLVFFHNLQRVASFKECGSVPSCKGNCQSNL